MFKNILIPTDGSTLSRKAIKAGVALARAVGARVTGFYSLEEDRGAHMTAETRRWGALIKERGIQAEELK